MHPAALAISTETDWPMLGVVLAGQFVTWAVLVLSGVMGVGKRAAAVATAATEQSAAIKTLATELGRLTKGLDRQTEVLGQHIVDDVRVQTGHGTVLTQVGETLTQVAARLENLQGQINNVARDASPAGGAIEVPGRRGDRTR